MMPHGNRCKIQPSDKPIVSDRQPATYQGSCSEQLHLYNLSTMEDPSRPRSPQSTIQPSPGYTHSLVVDGKQHKNKDELATTEGSWSEVSVGGSNVFTLLPIMSEFGKTLKGESKMGTGEESTPVKRFVSFSDTGQNERTGSGSGASTGRGVHEFQRQVSLADSIKKRPEHDIHMGIWHIIRDDKVGDLQYQLKVNPDLILNAKDNAGNTPIHIAAKYNRSRVLSVLLEWHADPNVSGPYDMYALHLAAKYNSLEVAKCLLHHNAAILCRDCKQKTPLHHAARKGHEAMVELLLFTEGCEIDTRDEDRLTPLHEACQLKQTKVAKYLIEHGADMDSRDIADSTPLLFAAAEGLTEVIEIILEKALSYHGISGKMAALNHVDNEGTSALHLAVMNCQGKAIDLLLDNGADLNTQNNAKSTPLHMAVIGGQLSIVTQLLERGANIEIRDGDHMTPVHRCSMYGKMDVLELLYEQGANINARTSEQMTPLLVASWKGHLSIVEFLITKGARILSTDSCMRTAIHWAVDQGNYNILQELINHKEGASLLEMMDHRDQTATHYAARTGNTMIMKLLIDNQVSLGARDQDDKTPLHTAAEYGNYASIEIQIDASQAQTNDGDSDGRSPLMLACLHGHSKAARSLLVLGADCSIRDENYCTAIILAASAGHVKVIQLLLDNLAEVNACDKIKNTALHMSAAGGHVEAVRLLLNRNASPVLLNSYKKAPLDMALDYEQGDVAVAMMRHQKWRDIMSVRDDDGFSPMKKLIRKASDATLVLMDNCVTESDHRKDDMEYFLKYDFHYIDPGPEDICCKNKRFFAIDTMIEYNREDLLSHPLTQSLLIMKWRKFGCYILYGNLFIYVMYVIALNTYMTVVPAIASNLIDNIRRCPINMDSESAVNKTLEEMKNTNPLSTMVIESKLLLSLQIILEVFIILLLIKELFTLWGQKWHYFVNPYMYINWTMMVSTLFFINPPNLYPCVDNWRGAWVSSLCAWTLLMSYLQKLDVVGIYFVMFSEVIFSIMKVMFVLLLFVMAFSQAFSAVIAQAPGFRDEDFFPLTVLAMTLGEINYVDTFVSSDNTPFTIDAYIIITIFMIVMPIAVINLLIGVAVGDIDKIQKQAYIKRLGLQTDQVNNSENRLPGALQRRLYQRYFVLKPNQEKNTRWAKFKYHVFGMQTSVEFIAQSEKDFTVETLQDLQKNVQKNKLHLTQIHSSLKLQQEQLRQLCDHFHVPVRHDVDNVSLVSDRTDFHSRLDV